jgi:hypothetical protein
MRLSVVPVLSGPRSGLHGRVVDESEADRLLLRSEITSSQHSTLMNLLKRLLKANFNVRSPSLEPPVQSDGSTIGDRQAKLVLSLNGLFAGLDAKIGKPKRIALVNLVLLDAPWPAEFNLNECITQLDRLS